MNPHCECELAGYCNRHQTNKNEDQLAVCKGTATFKDDCGFRFWKAWETGRLGATAQESPQLEEWDWCEPALMTRGLGDYAERIMKSVGITEDRYAEIKEKFGLPATCNCKARKKWLNAVGQYIGIGR